MTRVRRAVTTKYAREIEIHEKGKKEVLFVRASNYSRLRDRRSHVTSSHLE